MTTIKYKSYITNDIKLIQSTKVIDWDTVIEICIMEDKNFYNKIFKTFIEDLESKIDKINKTSDLQELHSLAHAIKGKSATIGFNLLSCCCYHYIKEFKIQDIDIETTKKNFICSLNEIKKQILDDISKNLDNIFI